MKIIQKIGISVYYTVDICKFILYNNKVLLCGGIPERPKGTDCKSAGDAFDGSNPSSPTTFYLNRCSSIEVFFIFYNAKHP